MNAFNYGQFFTPEVFILCKKLKGSDTLNFDVPEESVLDILSNKFRIFMAFLIFNLDFL